MGTDAECLNEPALNFLSHCCPQEGRPSVPSLSGGQCGVREPLLSEVESQSDPSWTLPHQGQPHLCPVRVHPLEMTTEILLPFGSLTSLPGSLPVLTHSLPSTPALINFCPFGVLSVFATATIRSQLCILPPTGFSFLDKHLLRAHHFSALGKQANKTVSLPLWGETDTN